MLVNLLTVLFVGLKLTDQIEWSWFWVVSPIWITFLLAVAVRIPGEWRKQVAARKKQAAQEQWRQLKKDVKTDGDQ